MTPVGAAAAGVFVAGVGALGLVVGSFLTVVVHRVPAGGSVVRPRWACPACASPIRSRDNVPVVSWVLLRGRCRSCAAVVPWRYPCVEAATGLLFAGLAVLHGPSAVLPALLYAGAVGVALVVIDLDHHRLPDAIVLPSYPVLVALLALAGALSGTFPAARTTLSAGLWLAVYGLIRVATAGRGMGLGDVKLAGLLGLLLGWLGWGPSVLGLLAGFVVGGVIGLALLATGRVGRGAGIAHGPFMLAGAGLAVIAGEPVWTAWLGLLGRA